MTAAEFNDLMKDLVRALRAPGNAAKLPRGQAWSLSYDNAGPHSKAAAHHRGMPRHPHPPKSPDCQKVVEHVHSYLTGKMQAWLWEQRQAPVTPEAAKAQLETAFSGYTITSLAADVDSLKGTYGAIIAAAGAYPAKKFR